MKAKNWIRRVGIFEVASIVVLLAAASFIAASMMAIVWGGMPYLRTALSSPEVRFSVWLSLSTASISTLLCMLLALPSAYALTRTSLPAPFTKLLQAIIEVPLSLPYLVLGLCLLIIFSSDFGKWLRGMGFRVVFDPKGIVMAQLIVNFSFVLRLVLTAMNAVDSRLEFVAGTMGASKWQRFLLITLPLSKHAILAAVILTWARAMGEFGATLMLVGVTRMKTETLPGSIYLNISTGDNGMAMASATILMLVSFGAIVVTNYFNRRDTGLNRTRDGMPSACQ